MSEDKKRELTIAIWLEIILKAFYVQKVDNFKNLCNQMYKIIGEQDADQVLTIFHKLRKKECDYV